MRANFFIYPMKLHRLYRRQFIARPLDDVFRFFEKPENLAAITPKSLRFSVVTPSPIRMAEGTIIEYRVSPLLIPMTWVSVIESYSPQSSFVDVQVRGPYAHWRHTHRFTPHNGGTIIEDEIMYAIPFGIFGEIARHLLVERRLNAIFDHRERVIRDIVESTGKTKTK